jgi:hypothetical protein
LGAAVGVKNVAKHRIYIEKAYSGVLVSQNAVLNLMSLMDAIKKLSSVTIRHSKKKQYL